MMENNNPTLAEVFGPVISSYTRAQAVVEGVQVEVSAKARQAGIRFPVFLTRAVYDAYVTVPPGVEGQDEVGRLFDIVWMTAYAIRQARGAGDRLPVALYVRNDNRRPRLVKLVAVWSGKRVALPPLAPLRTGHESFQFIRLKPLQSPAGAEPVFTTV